MYTSLWHNTIVKNSIRDAVSEEFSLVGLIDAAVKNKHFSSRDKAFLVEQVAPQIKQLCDVAKAVLTNDEIIHDERIERFGRLLATCEQLEKELKAGNNK